MREFRHAQQPRAVSACTALFSRELLIAIEAHREEGEHVNRLHGNGVDHTIQLLVAHDLSNAVSFRQAIVVDIFENICDLFPQLCGWRCRSSGERVWTSTLEIFERVSLCDGFIPLRDVQHRQSHFLAESAPQDVLDILLLGKIPHRRIGRPVDAEHHQIHLLQRLDEEVLRVNVAVKTARSISDSFALKLRPRSTVDDGLRCEIAWLEAVEFLFDFVKAIHLEADAMMLEHSIAEVQQIQMQMFPFRVEQLVFPSYPLNLGAQHHRFLRDGIVLRQFEVVAKLGEGFQSVFSLILNFKIVLIFHIAINEHMEAQPSKLEQSGIIRRILISSLNERIELPRPFKSLKFERLERVIGDERVHGFTILERLHAGGALVRRIARRDEIARWSFDFEVIANVVADRARDVLVEVLKSFALRNCVVAAKLRGERVLPELRLLVDVAHDAIHK
mmetsp:Transcript_13762/g.45258  ORF Transcript_13762/g.45258 Transcript_13762/m.45258 type:complete len:447 (+) Transcript_13762:2749-4089(+)